MKVTRLAVVVSHPIQHFCPQYCSWAALPGIILRVFFASRHGLTAYHDKNFDRVVQWDGLTLDFPHEFLPGSEGKVLGAGIDSPMLGSRLAEFAPDVIHLYGYSQKLQRRALAWATAKMIPILMMADSELHGRRNWAKRLGKAIVLPHILGKVHRFMTIGDANEAYFRNYGVSDAQFIRSCYPIDVKCHDQALGARDEVRKRVRRKLEIPDGHSVLLMVGKLVPWKRQSDLVDFSNSIQGSRDDVTVVLAGTGEDEAKLRGLAMHNGAGGVVFAGFVPPATLPEYYCASDIYVHCSEREPHSVAISEAIYCGLPVVLSDSCGSYGPTDDVRVGLNGYIYRCADVTALSSALLRIIGFRERRISMGLASSEIGRCNQQLAHGRALIQALDSLYP
jgi:glycosyltransferase involved in cell wall biosynthesis